MKAVMIAALALLPCSAFANGQRLQDRNIDQAAADIVAARIGDLRGGFAIGEIPEFVDGAVATTSGIQPGRATGRGDGLWQNGLAPARGLPAHRRSNI